MAFGKNRFTKKPKTEKAKEHKPVKKKTVLQLAEIAELDEKIANSDNVELIDSNDDKSLSKKEKERLKKEREEKIKEARAASKRTEKDVQQAKTERLMNLIAERASYYRANPHRFVEEFLGIHLKLFQKILIYAMMINDYFLFIAARGLGFEYLHLILASSCIYKYKENINE